MPLRQRSERKGDAWTVTVPKYDGSVRVSAHDDGGVTVSRIDHQGEETARISFMREEWDATVSHVEDSRKKSA